MRAQIMDLTTRYEQAQQAAQQSAAHQQRAEQAEQQLARLTVARAAGLPDAIADRLRGGTDQELVADAAALVAAITAMTTPALTPPLVPPATVPGLPVEALKPASPVGTAGPVEDTPEQIAQLVWGK